MEIDKIIRVARTMTGIEQQLEMGGEKIQLKNESINNML